MIVTKIISLIVLQCVMSQEPYIYKGKPAEQQQFPYMVAIRYARFLHEVHIGCSASLITPRKVLTAAHCFPKTPIYPSRALIVAGIVNLTGVFDDSSPKPMGFQTRTAIQITIHDNYDEIMYHHDIAVVFLLEPFMLNKYIRTIKISTDELPETANCTIVGYGETHNDTDNEQLMYANDVHATTVAKGCLTIRDGTFYCLVRGPTTICIGDSGGPLVYNGTVYGVASFGQKKEATYLTTDRIKCGYSNEEAYTNLNTEKEFIKTYLGDGSTSLEPFFNASIIALITFVIVTLRSIEIANHYGV